MGEALFFFLVFCFPQKDTFYLVATKKAPKKQNKTKYLLSNLNNVNSKPSNMATRSDNDELGSSSDLEINQTLGTLALLDDPSESDADSKEIGDEDAPPQADATTARDTLNEDAVMRASGEGRKRASKARYPISCALLLFYCDGSLPLIREDIATMNRFPVAVFSDQFVNHQRTVEEQCSDLPACQSPPWEAVTTPAHS